MGITPDFSTGYKIGKNYWLRQSILIQLIEKTFLIDPLNTNNAIYHDSITLVKFNLVLLSNFTVTILTQNQYLIILKKLAWESFRWSSSYWDWKFYSRFYQLPWQGYVGAASVSGHIDGLLTHIIRINEKNTPTVTVINWTQWWLHQEVLNVLEMAWIKSEIILP